MSASRRRLGRGLEALLGPTTAEASSEEHSLGELAVAAIRPNPYQPRNVFDESQLEELAQSMKTSGLLQPIVVRPATDGEFELIAGERRWRAAQRLGWDKISAVVREADDQTLLAFALVENLQRDALSAIDEARGYKRLVEDFNTSQTEVGALVGRSRAAVANALRLLKLPPRVQDLVHAGTVSAGHARALLGIENPEAVEAVADSIVRKGLSVREVEALVRRRTRRPKRSNETRPRDPHARRAEEELRRRLQTDVAVSLRGKDSGKISVNFYSHDDLARILEIVLGEPFNG